MSASQRMDLPSHEVLSQLAREDPQAYEAWRRATIDGFIASAPARIKPRLQGIQFRVESLRRLSRSPLGSTVKVYELMWKSFLSLNHNWQELARAKAECINPHDSPLSTQYIANESAKVLEFRQRPLRDQKGAAE